VSTSKNENHRQRDKIDIPLLNIDIPLLNIIQRYPLSCFSNEMKSKKYNTVGTVLKSIRKTKIQHCWNSSKI
jgi:hypothetical protein